MEITKMLTLSTIHITQETADKLNYELNNDVMFITVYTKEDYGWFIYLPENFEEIDVPEDLMKCLLFAKDLDCGILCLERDGEVLSYLNKYNW